MAAGREDVVNARWCILVALGLVFGSTLRGSPVLAADPRDRGPDTIDVSGYEPKYQELYKVFEVKCSKCHSLSRAVNARLKPDEWTLYVKKMKRRPGSGISDANAEQLIDFLSFHSKEQAKRRDDP